MNRNIKGTNEANPKSAKLNYLISQQNNTPTNCRQTKSRINGKTGLK